MRGENIRRLAVQEAFQEVDPGSSAVLAPAAAGSA
jgi:hypothetical protein